MEKTILGPYNVGEKDAINEAVPPKPENAVR
jgi:hypothetical protein